MSSGIGGKSDKLERKKIRQWLQKYNTQKPIVVENMFPSKTDDDKDHHFIISFELDKIEKEIASFHDEDKKPK